MTKPMKKTIFYNASNMQLIYHWLFVNASYLPAPLYDAIKSLFVCKQLPLKVGALDAISKFMCYINVTFHFDQRNICSVGIFVPFLFSLPCLSSFFIRFAKKSRIKKC